MANKYSEELFGAVDTIIAKRLQSLNKDTTILCNIEDDTDAEKGKYIVSNSGLRFNTPSAQSLVAAVMCLKWRTASYAISLIALSILYPFSA